ncbi:hypothetical protein GCM10009548_71630 [Streptomyces malaysiensis subsp. malaysiensis]
MPLERGVEGGAVVFGHMQRAGREPFPEPLECGAVAAEQHHALLARADSSEVGGEIHIRNIVQQVAGDGVIRDPQHGDGLRTGVRGGRGDFPQSHQKREEIPTFYGSGETRTDQRAETQSAYRCRCYAVFLGENIRDS